MKSMKTKAIEVFENGTETLPVDIAGDSLWMGQQEMATLFGVSRASVTRHIKNIIEDEELQLPAICSKIEHIGDNGKKYRTKKYNLDMIISVGYRVNSKVATRFRKWATTVLKKFIQDGYVVDVKRLEGNEDQLKALSDQIRKIRSSEVALYTKVKDVFKASSTDYDANSHAARTFFAIAQDKFHYAVTQKIAAELVLERADSKKKNMGMVHFSGDIPNSSEVVVGKNYLSEDELRAVENISEQFLLFAESKAFRGQKMTMEEISFKLNTLLQANDYPILYEYKQYMRPKADAHAKHELKKFKSMLPAGKNKKALKPAEE